MASNLILLKYPQSKAKFLDKLTFPIRM